METKKKFKMEMPSTCALLFMLTIFAAVLTWIIPAGEFDTEKVGNTTRVIAGTYHTIEQSPQGIWDILTATVTGFQNSAVLLVMIMFIGAAVHLLQKTGAIEVAFKSIAGGGKNANDYVIAFVLITFVIANSEIPTGSMENTIMTKSRVIGSRLHYTFGSPKRGDVAIFVFGWQCPECGVMVEGDKQEVCPACDSEIGRRGKTVYYVKRVIGMPGDTIDIADGKVYLNGSDTPLDEPYLAEPMDPSETFHFEVPEGCYFMMGDNRNYSLDARYWNNPYISEDKMVAKVLFTYFPSFKIIH